MAADFISRCRWVEFGGDGLGFCTRCGRGFEHPPLAGDFESFTAYVNGMVAVHASCVDPNAPELSPQSSSLSPEPGEEPTRQIEQEPAPTAAPVLPPKSVAVRLPNGSVWLDCRVHGKGAALVRGNRAYCQAKLVADGRQCDESAAKPGEVANQRANG